VLTETCPRKCPEPGSSPGAGTDFCERCKVDGLSFTRTLLGSLMTVMVPLLACSAMAEADQSLTPTVDCVVPQGVSATVNKVYFGYTNTGAAVSVPFGDSNEIVPGIQFQGQPTVFNTGTYERVFYAAWNPTAFQSIEWDLNGFAAVADSTTPLCVSGTTGTASDVTTSAATLHGDVNIAGEETTYHFEYGDGNGPDLSTPTETVLTGPQQTVSQPIAGLLPGDTYHFRIVATNSDGTTEGAVATFTTIAPTPSPTTTTVTVQAPSDTVTGPTTTVTGPVLPTAADGTSRFTLVTGTVPVQALAKGARRCSLHVVAGVTVTTSQRANVTAVASAAGIIAAQGRQASSGHPEALVLCLNRHGRRLVRAQGQRFRSLAATLVVRATSGTHTAMATVHLVFRRR
jgi:hypothetical protein